MNSATQLTILQSVAGIPVTLTRTGVTPVPLTAVKGFTRGELISADGTSSEFLTVDWLIGVAQTGSFGKPKRGDVIQVAATGTSYTIAHPDPTTKAVVPHGSDETAWRIHSIENH